MLNFNNLQFSYRWRANRRQLPRTAEEARASDLYKAWWFYDVEMFPGVVRDGIFPKDLPLPARMLMRNCNLQGADCLDIGSMEGLIPILMSKGGARGVLATDFSYHCYDKMLMLMKAHNVDFDFKKIGLLYDLSNKIPDRRYSGFDLINVSGVLYHVFSPFHVIAGLRPLLKKNGLMIVSTNIINRDDVSMEFNDRGKLQTEPNTFWYMSIQMMEYMLKYFQLKPIDYVYYRHSAADTVRFAKGYDAGYLGIICRATSDHGESFNDPWLTDSILQSWEYKLCDQEMIDSQPVSNITYKGETAGFDLLRSVNERPSVVSAAAVEDTHLLRLADMA
jgi:2-polyprenyl-3-methyl-5-hydroxy-6-metoxy-1,4-benzoquinol methylase